MKVLYVVCLAVLLTQANGLLFPLVGNLLDKIVNAGVQTTQTVIHNVRCAWLGILIPCKEMPGQHGPSAPLPTRCDAIADILIVVDASSSIGRTNYNKVLSTMANMAGSFNLGPDKVRFSCVVFSDRATLWFKLNDYNTIEAVQKAILKIPYYGGVTYTDKALSLISTNNLFGSAAGGRANAPNILILFTDGQSTNPIQTRTSANYLKNQGVKMFSVGITNNVNEAELRGVSSGPEYVFRANNFDDLADKLALIVNRTCAASNGVEEHVEETEPPTTASTTTTKATTTTTTTKAPPPEVIPCRNITIADIMFAIDASTSIGQENWKRQTKFAADIANAFNVGPKEVLFGAEIFNRNVTSIFNLKTFTNKDDVIKALLSIVYPYNPGTYTHLAFLEIRTKNLFGPEWGGRVDSKKVVIVMTDGQSAYPDKTVTESQLLRDTGVLIISVGIGVTNTDELEAMASKPEYVFTTGSYESLDYIKRDLVQLACNNW